MDPDQGHASSRHTVPSGVGAGRHGAKRERAAAVNTSIEVVVLVRGPRAIDPLSQFAHSHGLTVVERQPARRFVVLSGTLKAFADAFAVHFVEYQSGKASYRDVEGEPSLPDPLASRVVYVHGLETRPDTRKAHGKESETVPVA